MQPDDSEPVEGTDDQLLAAVAELLPALPNIEADIADRFAQGVRALVEARAQSGWPGETQGNDVAAFVFVDRPREVGARFEATAVTDPIATTDGILGRLFLMNRDCSNGRSLTFPVEPGALIDWLSDNGLANRPLVLVYRATQLMITRKDGADGVARKDRIRSTKPTATLDELLEALDHFHKTQLTPACCVRGVWELGRASNYIPGSSPERAIQSELQTALNFWFHGVVKAEVEDTTSIGRLDVRLLKRSAEEGSLAYWAIIELKVIKSFANAPAGQIATAIPPGQNIEAIVEGLKQAWAYRHNRFAEEGLLEIFDLRRDKKDDLLKSDKVIETLKAFEPPPPLCAVRELFGSSKDARDSGYTGI
jgi:hypothetical protein